MSLLKVRRIIMYSVVSAILIVASFGIYNVISTVVLEKTRDIAIIKSVGFHARDILFIFLTEGAIVGAIGSVLGTGLGLAMMEALPRIRSRRLSTPSAPSCPRWGWSPVALGIGFAMISALVAAFLPARKGASVHPVDILRGRRMSIVVRTEGLTRVLPGEVPVTLVEDITSKSSRANSSPSWGRPVRGNRRFCTCSGCWTCRRAAKSGSMASTPRA